MATEGDLQHLASAAGKAQEYSVQKSCDSEYTKRRVAFTVRWMQLMLALFLAN